ncbi:hypothetical protein [Xenorhabdus anantnagensis]|uniref:Uncharacterized protein n=1 Tax=Xenorhabdus anantnagensis TaxID=3025875 RepID=A0ABT5LTQ0_9GAMM|nr:hypothetical protein [Xenorhabdus anantnagensis]MDC9597218.1 hypothetical protein [Xenorhabdus anantnagensis]
MFKRVSDQGHRSGLAQEQGSLPDVPLMRHNPSTLSAFSPNCPVDVSINPGDG